MNRELLCLNLILSGCCPNKNNVREIDNESETCSDWFGDRGSSILEYILLKMAGVEIVAVCDEYEDRVL